MDPTRYTFPSALEACFLVFALFLIEMVLCAVVIQFGLNWRDATGFVSIVANGILFSVLLHYKQQRYANLMHHSSSSALATFLMVALPVAMLVPGLVALMSGLQYLVQAVFPLTDGDRREFAAMQAANLGTVLLVCLIAPVVEEMLFRGIILRSFLSQYSRTTAIVASAVIFGAAHFNVYQFAVGFCMGLVLGWLFERTRSLWPCMLLHLLFNASVTVLAGLQAEEGAVNDATVPALLTIAVMLAVGLVGAYVLRRLLEPSRAR